jgi:hypothetical protein
MKRTIEALIFLALGGMLASIGLAAHEVERRPSAICVPLYDKLPLECTECQATDDQAAR